jgi:hypothetical protein
MEQYTIIKSFVMLMALVGAFSFFFIRVRRLYRVMMAVEGTTEFKLDQVAARIGVLFKDVIGQANVRRKRLPGLAHTLIFFGFLAVQPHSLELMIKGVCPAFDIGHWIPGLYTGGTCLRPISWPPLCWSALPTPSTGGPCCVPLT